MVSLFVIKKKGTRLYFVGMKGNKFLMCKGCDAATIFISRDAATEQKDTLNMLRTDPVNFQVVRKYFENVELVEL